MAKLLSIFAFVGFFLPSVATPANVVYNGGFDTGDFTGWILSGNPIPGTVSSSHPYSGAYAAQLFAAGSLGYLEQFLPTTPGATYSLTYFLASDGGVPNEFSTQVNGVILWDQTDIPSHDYSQYSFTFQATSSATDLKFGFRDDPGALLLDDISATAVPEPASPWLGVFLIGAVAAKSRKSGKV